MVDSPPSERGYNIFDPHDSDDGVTNSYDTSYDPGDTNGTDGVVLTFGKNNFWYLSTTAFRSCVPY